jgi:phosphomannomutase
VAVSFGSDGYRGVIGHTLTREVIARIVLGVADYLRGQRPQGIRGLKVPVGYDTRFLSLPLARFAAQLLAREGLSPHLCRRACPSPYLAFVTHFLEAPLGLQFTASHNPPLYNGLKLKGAHGGSMLPAEVAMLEFYADAVQPERFAGVPLFVEGKLESETSYLPEYRAALDEAAQGAACPGQYVVVDYMHGCTAGIYRELLGEYFTVSTELRTQIDPLFGGGRPEPVPENLQALRSQVLLDGHDCIGLAFDGDGDRLAVVDEAGCVLEPHELLALLTEYVVRLRGPGGFVVKTVSLSQLVDLVAEAHGCRVIEVPVGFKSVSDAMLEYSAIIGGEESGGIAFGHYLPERDALLMALMLVKARRAAEKTLHEMVEELYARFGRLHFLHRDIALPPGIDRLELKTRLASLANLGSAAGDKVDSLNHRDGMKLRTAYGWVLARASGTEPIVRVYAEAPTAERAAAYAEEVVQYLHLRS